MLQIRGAPAIASLAALGTAAELLALLAGRESPAFPASSLDSATDLLDRLLQQTAHLLTSRPTAVNLLEALSRIESAAKDTVQAGSNAVNLAEMVINVCISVWDDDRERNVQMGDHGADWILDKLQQEGSIQSDTKINVLTVSGFWTGPRRSLSSTLAQVCNTGSLATSVSFDVGVTGSSPHSD